MGKVIMNQLIEELYSKIDNQEKIIRTLQQKIICELNEYRNLRNYLKQKIKECDDYMKHISQEVRKLTYRTSGKTFLANEIMKSTIAKKTYEEILERMDCE